MEYLMVVEIWAISNKSKRCITLWDDAIATSAANYEFYSGGRIELRKKPQYNEQLKGLELLKCLGFLEISELVMEILFPPKLSANLGCLEVLDVKECQQLEEVFRFEDLNLECYGVPRLTAIGLRNLSELRSIWTGTVPAVRFPNLKNLNVDNCPKLMKLFTPSMTKALPQLECLVIFGCSNLATIIASDVEEDAVACSEPINILLPKLKTLKLFELDELTSLVQPEILLGFPSLEILLVIGCPKLKSLPVGPQSLPNLRTLEAGRIWFDELECQESTKLQLEHCFVEWSPGMVSSGCKLKSTVLYMAGSWSVK